MEREAAELFKDLDSGYKTRNSSRTVTSEKLTNIEKTQRRDSSIINYLTKKCESTSVGE